MRCLPGALLSLLQLFSIFYVACVLLGAPAFNELYSTCTLSLWLSILTGLPLCIVYRSNSQVKDFVLEARLGRGSFFSCLSFRETL